ncbi:MAG: transcriptional repressor LexA [Haloplasmataceae bacterium]|nr:transcriptional repressor LexA [Haloplasmataceae bacterium]
MIKISEKQQEILDFISEFLSERGYPPTVREIGKAVGLSSSASVHSQLNKLEKKGFIKKEPTSSRAISIVKEDQTEYISIPVLGKVTAGNPIEAIENCSDYFQIPANLVKSNDVVFMLTVSGNSMKNAGILDNDRIIVKKSDTADNGEIIVALTDENEATVKRFFKESNHFRLQPENEEFEPIILPNVSIVGKVIGLYREIM